MELFRLNKNQEWLVYFRELGKKVNFDSVFWFFISNIEKNFDLITSFLIGLEFN